MTGQHQTVLTIGHSTHSLEKFLELLRQHNVTAVADVRSSPYSRFNPQFNKEALQERAKEYGISYVFLGEELGARSKDPSCYVDGRLRYDLLAHTESFRSGLERVRKGSESHRVALMCAEKEPLDCHRTILVSRELAALGLGVKHILSDGSTETLEHSLERLVYKSGLDHSDLFRSRAELIAEACDLQEERIAPSSEPSTPRSADVA